METFIPNFKLSTIGDFVQHYISDHICSFLTETIDIIIRYQQGKIK